jgi:hypothetical protein
MAELAIKAQAETLVAFDDGFTTPEYCLSFHGQLHRELVRWIERLQPPLITRSTVISCGSTSTSSTASAATPTLQRPRSDAMPLDLSPFDRRRICGCRAVLSELPDSHLAVRSGYRRNLTKT